MDGKDTKALVWTIGAQMIALAISLMIVFVIVWAASKAWKKGQEKSESNYLAINEDWLGY
jgi:hypothetical protein